MGDFRHLNLPLTRDKHRIQLGRGLFTLVPYQPAPAYRIGFSFTSGIGNIQTLLCTDYERAGPLWEDDFVLRYYRQNLKTIDPFAEGWIEEEVPRFDTRLYDLEFFDEELSQWHARPDLNLSLNLAMAYPKGILPSGVRLVYVNDKLVNGFHNILFDVLEITLETA